VLIGGLGNDTLIGGAAGDALDGGFGEDMVDYSTSPGAVQVNLAMSAALGSDADGDVLSGFENATGSAFNDVLTGDGGANVINGAGGNDTISSGAGDDTVLGGTGNDTMNGAAGTDTVDYSSATAGVTVSLAISAAQNTVGAGTDTLQNFENLTGSAFNDILTGDGGNNIIIGGAGNDTMNGGAGNDSFVFNAGFGQDTITAFGDAGTNQDVIDFSTAVFANFAAVQAAIHQVGADVHIDVNASTSITLTSFTATNLGADDFRFH